MNFLSRIYNYCTELPSALTLATRELQNAERALLAAASELEYAASLVSYNEKRISRLKKVIEQTVA